MTNFEIHHLGNIRVTDIRYPKLCRIPGGFSYSIPSLEEHWTARGYTWEEGYPLADDTAKAERLAALGYVSVTLMIPKTEEAQADQN